MSEKNEKVMIGIDLGGTGIKIGIVDSAFAIIAQTTIPTRGERPYQQLIADMGHASLAVLEENG